MRNIAEMSQSSETKIMGEEENILDPHLQIIDPHHHLWLLPKAERATEIDVNNPYAVITDKFGRYLFDELLCDLKSGHDVRGTVFLQANAMYRASGPEELRSVGEIEFANGIAAMFDSGVFGDIRACAGIVGSIDLMGSDPRGVLEAHMRAGGDRYRGIRPHVTYDKDVAFRRVGGTAAPRLMFEEKFRNGVNMIGDSNIVLDLYALEPQLPDVVALARACSNTQIVVDHTGTPLGMASYSGRREHRFSDWQRSIRELARCENVVIKLSGLGMPICGFRSFNTTPKANSTQLADKWRPYFETCIEEFGADRCMFASNFPVDGGTCSYLVLWNAFKRVVGAASIDEKRALFFETASRIYNISLDF